MENKPSLPAEPEKDTPQVKPPKSGHHVILAIGAVASSFVNQTPENDRDILKPEIDIMNTGVSAEASTTDASPQSKAS